MGTQQHHHLVFKFDIAYRGKDLLRAQICEIAGEFACCVSPIVESPINGYCWIYFAPDGSKCWWEPSKQAQRIRSELIDFARNTSVLCTVFTHGELGQGVGDQDDQIESAPGLLYELD